MILTGICMDLTKMFNFNDLVKVLEQDANLRYYYRDNIKDLYRELFYFNTFGGFHNGMIYESSINDIISLLRSCRILEWV